MTRESPVLTTERLTLSKPVLADLQPCLDMVTNEHTARFLGPTTTLADFHSRFMRGAGSWALYGYGFFMVRMKGQDEIVGQCGIFHSIRGLGEDFDDMPEAGWIIHSDHEGRGIAREAMLAALEWFEENFGKRRIACMIEIGNDPSVGLAKRLGFKMTRDADLPDDVKVHLLHRDPA